MNAVVSRLVGTAQRERSLTRLVAFTIAVFVLFSALRPYAFFTPLNFQSIAYSVPEIGLLGLAVSVAMLSGGIDLSIVSVANLAALTTASLLAAPSGAVAQASIGQVAYAVVAGVAVGALCGLCNGLLIAKAGITPILATLGTMQFFAGVAIIWTGGESVYGLPPEFLVIGTATLAGVPVPFLIFLGAALVLGVFINRSGGGLRTTLVGANPTASRYSGVANSRVLLMAYMVSAMLASLSGIIIAARTASASPEYGASYLLLAIVIAVLGGTNPYGGYTTVTGVALAAVALSLVSSGFNILRLSPYLYQIAQGAILIWIVVLANRPGGGVFSRWKGGRIRGADSEHGGGVTDQHPEPTTTQVS